MKKKERERLKKLISEHTDPRKTEIQDEDPGINYADEYKKQTGKDLADGASSDRYAVQ